MAKEWPEAVPVLAPSDMHIGALNGPPKRNGEPCCCLVGWTYRWFGRFSRLNNFVLEAIEEAVKETDPKGRSGFTVYNGRLRIADYQDRKSKAFNARIWNRAMAILGYVTGNPEARWWAGILRKRKPKK